MALFILQEKENDFYDLTKFCEKNDIKDREIIILLKL